MALRPLYKMASLHRIAFVVNQNKKGASELADQLVAIATHEGVSIKKTAVFPVPVGYLEGQDACCVIGGDGTLLSVVAESARAAVPLIGVNRGDLGFLTTFSAEEAIEKFARLLAGNFMVTTRSTLECRVGGNAEGVALNDVVIKERTNSRLVALEVYTEQGFVTEFLSDGLIFTTPTGSTAYNLSAGGPIIHPLSEVIAMTPICPHTLSNRSIIFHQNTRLRVRQPEPESKISVVIDGHPPIYLNGTGEIDISLSPLQVKLIQRHDYDHFSILRTKLGWIGRHKKKTV